MPNSIKKFSLALSLIVCLFGLINTVQAEVRLPHGEFLESTEDLKVKVLGGYISMIRTWDKGQWHFNPAWNTLKFTYDSLDGSVKSIDRVSAEYKRTTPGTFVLDASSIIKVTASGYRWQDNTGNWIDYNAQGVVQVYGDRNDIKVSFQYDGTGKRTGVFDHYGNQALWYEYTSDRLTAIRDSTNRRVTYQYTGNDLTAVVDVLNNPWRYAYLSPTKLSVITDPENRTLTLTYDGGGRVASAKDRDNIGYTYEYDYDANKREYFVRQRTSDGRITETWYDAQANIVRKDINGKTVETHSADTATRAKATTDSRGLTTIVTRDQWDNIIKVVYPDGTTVTTTYDPQYSNPLIHTDELGVVTKYEYDAKGNLTRLIEAFGLTEQRITEYTYNQFGQRITENRKGSLNNSIPDALMQFGYHASGAIIQLTDAENYVTRYPIEEYDVVGVPKIMIDARDKVWKRTYDSKGNVLTETDPLNHINTYVYYPSGLKMSTTDTVNNITQYGYGTRQNITTITDPYGAVTTYEYNSNNQRTKYIDSENKVLRTIEYDLDGRLSKKIDGNGNSISYLYGDTTSGLDGLLVKVIYPTFSQEYKYDSRNRITEVIDIDDTNTRFVTRNTYDAVGNLLSVTNKGGTITTYTYDALRRLKTVTDPGQGIVEYTYDNRDNVLSFKDQKDLLHRFEYDRRNYKIKEIRPLGQAIDFTYDGLGNITQLIDAKGQVKKFIYDDANRLTQEQHFLSIADVAPVKTITYSFNDLSYLSGYNDGATVGTYIYDAKQLRKLEERVNYGTFTLSNSYDYFTNGQKRSFTGPDGETVRYTYDANNQLATVQLSSTSITINSYRWTAPSLVTYPGGTTRAQTHNSFLWPTQIHVKGPGQNAIMNYQYGYDSVGLIRTKITDHGSYSYGYDDLYRLKDASNPNPLPNESYTYDAVGNRLTDAKTSQVWEYNNNNQLQHLDGISFQYDANGNITRKIDANNPSQTRVYVYDTSDRLTAVTDQNNIPIASYIYGPFGQRLGKEIAGLNVKKWYFYSDEGLVAEADDTGNLTVSYGYKPDSTWSTNPLYLKSNNQTYYFLNDHLGTPQMVIASSGQVAWSAKAEAFGTTILDQGSVITNNLRFPGQYYDSETGLHYNWNRYYDPQIGRYITNDPIGFEGGVNQYLYAAANPILNFDSNGLITWSGSGTEFSAAFGPAGGTTARWTLKTECINGKKGKAVVKANGFTVGARTGAKSKSPEGGGTYGGISFEDYSIDEVKCGNFNGNFQKAGFSFSPGTSIFSHNLYKCGKARARDTDTIGDEFGWDIGISATLFGQCKEVVCSIEKCCDK